jgi:hypothetical protein
MVFRADARQNAGSRHFGSGQKLLVTLVIQQVTPLSALAPFVSFFKFRRRDLWQILRIVAVSWFALFIDATGMDAVKLWCGVFPQYADQTLVCSVMRLPVPDNS